MPSHRSQQMARYARRAYPIILAAYERWQSLPDEEKERYKAQVRSASARGRRMIEQRRRRGGGGRGSAR